MKLKNKTLIFIGSLLLTICLGAQPAHASQNRISGSSRYDTAIQISQALFENADAAILANGHQFIDALPGSTLANILNAPILLTQADSLPKATLQELNRLKVKNIYILGGKATIKESLERELTSSGFQVQRIGGVNRYHSSELIYQEILRYGQISETLIAANEADAVSSSGLRGKDMPLILVNDQAPSDFVKNLKVKKTCLGGNKSISQKTYREIKANQRIYGDNRFSTAVKIAEASVKPNLLVVNSHSFVDAFTASVYAYNKNADILLTTAQTLNQETAGYIQKLKAKNITVIGGENAVSDPVYKQLMAMIDSNPILQSPWKKAYDQVIQDDDNLRKLPIESFSGSNGRDGKIINKSYALFDIDQNGIPELVLNLKYDSQVDVRFSELLIFTWDQADNAAKYLYGASIQDAVKTYRGFTKDANLLMVGDVLQGCGSIAFLEYRDGAMKKLREYYRNKEEYSLVEYQNGKTVKSDKPITEEAFDQMLVDSQKGLQSLSNILTPYKGLWS